MPESNTRASNLRDRLLNVDVVNHTEREVAVDPLAAAVRSVLKRFDVAQAEIGLAIVDDPTIRELNVTHLNHDYETDVLTFQLSEPGDLVLSGDIIVSVDTAVRVAGELNCSPEQELLLYAIHGALHLVGQDDGNPEKSREMKAWEQVFLGEFGYNQA